MHRMLDRIKIGLDYDYNRISSLNQRIWDSYYSTKNATSLNTLCIGFDGLLKEKLFGSFKEKKTIKKVKVDKILKENLDLNFMFQ